MLCVSCPDGLPSREGPRPAASRRSRRRETRERRLPSVAVLVIRAVAVLAGRTEGFLPRPGPRAGLPSHDGPEQQSESGGDEQPLAGLEPQEFGAGQVIVPADAELVDRLDEPSEEDEPEADGGEPVRPLSPALAIREVAHAGQHATGGEQQRVRERERQQLRRSIHGGVASRSAASRVSRPSPRAPGRRPIPVRPGTRRTCRLTVRPGCG